MRSSCTISETFGRGSLHNMVSNLHSTLSPVSVELWMRWDIPCLAIDTFPVLVRPVRHEPLFSEAGGFFLLAL